VELFTKDMAMDIRSWMTWLFTDGSPLISRNNQPNYPEPPEAAPGTHQMA
jgi:hypothetical protein